MMPRREGEGVPGGRERPFLQKPQGVVSVVGGVVAIVAAVLAMVFDLFPGCEPRPPQPKLELSVVDVAREKDIVADWTVDDEPQPAMKDWSSSVLSIALRNRSDDEVMLTDADFAIESVTQLGCPYGAGASIVTARYDIKVPPGFTPPDTLTRRVPHEVPAHGTERIGFTIGPEVQPAGALPTVYTFTVTLAGDDGSRLTTDRVVFMNPQHTEAVLEAAANAVQHGTGPTTPKCVREQARKARELAGSARLVAPELKEYSKALNKIAGGP
ncbi:hypothetical protein LG634_03645 [Streptomyces bambusae]|uniref:hypothetical protein n=1 Tax=Streptomyces bambusae TaxID=1550616 RepID=UPI001CFD9A67|nr:hypothetical protein [Streptomyces bambusae]MCB5163930.1 hypothetical protein [Streptomyces bambusae]